MKEIKRVVSTDFWTDKKVLNDFSPEDKYFMLYLLTNPYTTQLGIYNFPIKHAAIDMGYSEDSIRVLLDRFENKYGIIKYSTITSEIAIKNFLRHSIVKGGKPVFDCIMKEYSQVVDKSLVSYVFDNISNYKSKDINKTVLDIINNIKAKEINENDNENDNDNERFVDESYHESYHDSLSESFFVNDIESKWNALIDIYPKKTGLANAKVVWMKYVSSIVIDNQSDVADSILVAAEYYKNDYMKNHKDDCSFTYIPKLENWLKDIDYWLLQIEKTEKQNNGDWQ